MAYNSDFDKYIKGGSTPKTTTTPKATTTTSTPKKVETKKAQPKPVAKKVEKQSAPKEKGVTRYWVQVASYSNKKGAENARKLASKTLEDVKNRIGIL